MAKGDNTQLTAELKGISSFGNYTTPTANKDKVQALIDLISPESTQVHRGMLDQINPLAHKQLIVELRALKTAVANV